ncbi:type II secretion system minor pseudopilin GspK [Ningiella sp. W23]|uniref:type II secretion system minor pseudopilin GspK n=1 Tax=Ningiella sp. W23 TaxID=3023715 RepID=UPI003756D802
MSLLRTNKSSFRQNQKGVALVVVLLIVALVSILATQMVSRLQLNVVRAQNIKDNNQAYWYALGAEEFARKSLSAIEALSPDNINLSQPWAQRFEYPIDGGSITAELSDMQACFNLNAVNSKKTEPNPSGGGGGEEGGESGSGGELDQPEPDPRSRRGGDNGRTPSQQAFHNLLDFVIEDSYTVDVVTDSMIDWLDEDDNPSNYGAEDVDYESLANPYLAANSAMSSKSELRLINGVSEGIRNQWLQNLLPLVCVIPEENLALNVNTVTEDTAHVLAALLGDDVSTAQTIISNRPPEGFANIEDFKNLPAVTALDLQAEQLGWFSLDTKYFKLRTTAKYNEAQFSLSTLFSVDGDSVTVVRREFGIF